MDRNKLRAAATFVACEKNELENQFNQPNEINSNEVVSVYQTQGGRKWQNG